MTATRDLAGYLRDLGFHEMYPKEGLQRETEPSSTGSDRGGSREERANVDSPAGSSPTLEARTVVEIAPESLGPDSRPSGERVAASERLRILEEAKESARSCVACRLSEGRTQVVFGTGNPDADLLFVGEGPGYHEDRQGEPFVGAAGQLLDRIIQAIDLERSETYIANVVKCRPPDNRDPQPDEVAACSHFLRSQIAAVAPRVIVCLGRVAAQSLLETKAPLGRLRGRWFEVEGVRTRVTYHPAALLRNESLKRPTWEDMQLIRDLLRSAESS